MKIIRQDVRIFSSNDFWDCEEEGVIVCVFGWCLRMEIFCENYLCFGYELREN